MSLPCKMLTALSYTAFCNLFTMGCASKVDKRQALPEKNYVELTEEQRVVRARLSLEEALEKCAALGVDVSLEVWELNEGYSQKSIEMEDLSFEPIIKIGDAPFVMNIDDAIDACCDIIYVAQGTLMAMGVPDQPHMNEVNACNNLKFPGGVPLVDAHGKFQKPEGWKAPNHERIRKSIGEDFYSFATAATSVVETGAEPNGDICVHKL